MREDLFRFLGTAIPWASLFSAAGVALVKFWTVAPQLYKEWNRRYTIKAVLSGQKPPDPQTVRLLIALMGDNTDAPEIDAAPETPDADQPGEEE